MVTGWGGLGGLHVQVPVHRHAADGAREEITSQPKGARTACR